MPETLGGCMVGGKFLCHVSRMYWIKTTSCDYEESASEEVEEVKNICVRLLPLF